MHLSPQKKITGARILEFVENSIRTFILNIIMMVQMIPNAALIEGTITAVENYPSQEGFCIVTLLVVAAQEKDGIQFLGDGLIGKDTKILLSEILRKKLTLQVSILVKGEIKKITPSLWRAIEETWQLQSALKKSSKKTTKK